MILPESSYNNPVFPRLKPWKEFFSKFSLPTRKNILQRLEDNVLYFQTNYLIVGALCLLLSVIKKPIILFVLPTIGFVWWFAFFYKSGDVYIRRFNFRIKKNIIIFLTIGVTYFFVIYTGSWLGLIYSSTLSIIGKYKNQNRSPMEVIGIHATFYNRGTKIFKLHTEQETTSYIDPEVAFSPIGGSTWSSPSSTTGVQEINLRDVQKPSTPLSSSGGELSQRQRSRAMRQRIREQYGLN